MGKRRGGLQGRQRGRHCKKCHGTGRIEVPAVRSFFGPSIPAHTKTCDKCQGRGKL